ncbi:MAG TPA: helix-turn-helix domain-containing protein [Polyangia bacterium]|nr:helix-turn-helix domain-containing protein [Polyangia bacterium]
MFDEKIRFVAAFLDKNDARSMTELCRAFGVSRNTGYEVLARYRDGGFEALRNRSRAPLHHANITAPQIEDIIVAERLAHRKWGPKKLLELLHTRHPEVAKWPAISTAGQVLRRRGLVIPRKTRHRTCPIPPISTGKIPRKFPGRSGGTGRVAVSHPFRPMRYR